MYIQYRTPVLDIVNIAANSLTEVGIASQTVDLSPASHSGNDIVAGVIVENPLPELFDKLGPFGPGPNETEIAYENIPELRQFVEIPSSHEGPESQLPIIILRGPAGAGFLFRVKLHTADLYDSEEPSAAAHSNLTVEDRPRRLQIDEQRKDRDDRCADKQSNRSANDVDGTLQRPIDRMMQREFCHPEDWHTADCGKLQARDENLEPRWNHHEVNKALFAFTREAQHIMLVKPSISENYDVDETLLAQSIISW